MTERAFEGLFLWVLFWGGLGYVLANRKGVAPLKAVVAAILFPPALLYLLALQDPD